jgi:hypothetical protein
MATYAMIAKDKVAVEFAKNVILNTWAGEAYEILGEMQENYTDYWVVGRRVGYETSVKSKLSPFCIKKSDTIAFDGVENVNLERMKLFTGITEYEKVSETPIEEKAMITCHLCGYPQETAALDEVKLKSMIRLSSVSFREIKKVQWKYVCDECISTKKYWEWARTDAANGHIALQVDAKLESNRLLDKKMN